MTTLMIVIDTQTESTLRELSARDGSEVSEIAARLLSRAVRASRPRPVYDADALKAAYAPFAEQDLALAESAIDERAALLQEEDKEEVL
jgi:hypothetical protein